MNKAQSFLTANYYQILGVLVIVAFLTPLLTVSFSVQIAWFTFQTVLIVALATKIIHDRLSRSTAQGSK